jgi:hypothetical protein
MAGPVAEQCGCHRVLHEHLAQVRQDQRRSVVQAIQYPQQRRGYVGRGGRRSRGIVPGHPEQVVPFGTGQPQGAGERGEHLLAGLAAALLLDAGVIVHGHGGQRGDLLATQPGRAAARASG